MASTLAPEVADRFAGLGRTEGLAGGLRAILAEGLPVPRSATGLTLVPEGGGHEAAPHALAEAAGLRMVRLAPSPERSDHEETRTAVLLAAVRLGVIERLLELAVQRLASRHVDGVPLTDKQLVQGTIAEAVASIELCRRGLCTAAGPAAAEALHARLADAGWSIVALFGASGYLRDHATLDFYAAELVHDAWVA